MPPRDGARPPWDDALPPWSPTQPTRRAAEPPWPAAQPPTYAAEASPYDAQPSRPSQPTAQPSRPGGRSSQPGAQPSPLPRRGAQSPRHGAQPARGDSQATPSGQPFGQDARSRRGAHARQGPGRLRLVWVYPDLLSTYGDRGNLLILERRARLRGLETESVMVNADQPVPRQGDIYLMGGGEDLPQILAARRLRSDGGLAAAARRGAVVFAVCAGYQLLGSEFGGEEGQSLPGLEILDIRSGRGDRRGVGEILADVDPALGVSPLTGFENHQGVTSLGPNAAPLARVVTGVGNGDGTEGAYAGRVVGTYLHGPVLVRNPALADLLLSWAAGPLPPLPAHEEEWTKRLREQRLAAVPTGHS